MRAFVAMRSSSERTLTAATVWFVLGAVALAFAIPARASEGFKVEKFENSIDMGEGGPPATQAGIHPYQMTTTLMFDHQNVAPRIIPDGDLRNLEVNLPAGLIANPTATASRCTETELEHEDDCPNASAVGVATVDFNLNTALEAPEPVYNMVPPPGVPAEFGFNLAGLGIVVHIVGRVRTGGDYGLSAEVANVDQRAVLYGTTLTLWGSPSSVSHDKQRGECLHQNERAAERGEPETFICLSSPVTEPFLTLPGSCPGTPLTATMRAESWQEPGIWTPLLESSPAMPAIEGCEKLPFSPKLTVQPETEAADSASGLSVDLQLPQEESLTGLAEADLKDAVVTLPAGMTVSPSAANGLGACTDTPEPASDGEPERLGGEIELQSDRPVKCPDSSKVGTVKIVTPLLEQPLEGAVYLAQPYGNPFGSSEHPGGSLLALYVVAEGSGALVKLAGHVEADPVTGQLTTRFEGNPQPVEPTKSSPRSPHGAGPHP
jgi:hypothetical protein